MLHKNVSKCQRQEQENVCRVLHLSGQRDATGKDSTTSSKRGCLFRSRLAGFSGVKVKVKAVCWSYSTDALRHIVLLPLMSSFIHLQRRCTHQAA